MRNSKQLKLFKSFRAKLVLALILLALAILLVFIIKSKHPGAEKKQGSDSLTTQNSKPTEEPETKPADLKFIQGNLDKDIDSILNTFGIKKEWITTLTPGQKMPTTKSAAPKRNSKEAAWFVKDVLIPKDLTSAEVNLDISLFVNKSGLLPAVNEDIKTKDIILDVNKIGDTLSLSPLARIYISHSDKVSRETGTFCIILNGIGDYKKDEIDYVLNTTSEYSFIFPRNLENIELQNRLTQTKKDVVINLTISAKDNSDADFAAADDKEIKLKVKSFSSDFPGITKVILTKAEGMPLPPGLIAKITDEFTKFSIKVFNDSMLTPLLNKTEEDSKDKIKIIINNLKTKALQTGKGISVLNLSYDDFTKFSEELLVLKKLGYKFYNLTDYLNKESEKIKKDKLKDEKDVKNKPYAKKLAPKKNIKTKDKKKNNNPKKPDVKKKK